MVALLERIERMVLATTLPEPSLRIFFTVLLMHLYVDVLDVDVVKITFEDGSAIEIVVKDDVVEAIRFNKPVAPYYSCKQPIVSCMIHIW